MHNEIGLHDESQRTASGRLYGTIGLRGRRHTPAGLDKRHDPGTARAPGEWWANTGWNGRSAETEEETIEVFLHDLSDKLARDALTRVKISLERRSRSRGL